jgi:hypothetical protein
MAVADTASGLWALACRDYRPGLPEHLGSARRESQIPFREHISPFCRSEATPDVVSEQKNSRMWCLNGIWELMSDPKTVEDVEPELGREFQ